MGLTLVEASKIAAGRDDIYTATIIELYARNSDLLMTLPFEDISGNSYSFNREKELPGTDFRKINEGYTESTGKVEKITDTLTIAGGDIDVDKFLVDTTGASQRVTQTNMKVKSLSLKLTKQIIKGDTTSDPESFDGLQARITDSSQIINNSTAASGAALSIVKLDEAIDAVESPTHLIMTKAMRRIITAAARTSTVGGYITYSVDAFGRKLTQYNDLPILIIDKDDTNTAIMSFDEAAVSGSSVCQSIYVISTAADGVLMLQNGGMRVSDLGEAQDKPVYRTRIEWYTTLSMRRLYAAARLRCIQNAAAGA